MKQIEHGKYESDSLYGDGDAGEKMVDIIRKVELTIEKRITY